MSLSSLEGLDVNHLTEGERDAIMTVLRRDDSLRHKDDARVTELRADIKKIRLQGVLRDGQDSDKSCARCRTEFGWLFNTGAVCSSCQFKICDKCREETEKGKWLCTLCYKQKELEAMSGKWFYDRFRKSKRHKRSKHVITGGEIIKASFRKQHTPSEVNALGVRRRGPTRGRRRMEGEDNLGSGTADRGVRVTEDIKRALTNNNASPKRGGGGGATHSGPEEESSDTQSMELESPRRRPRPGPHAQEGDAHYADFPRDSDRQMLMDLMHTSRSPRQPAKSEQFKTQRIQVSSHRYDSDSSSASDSAPSSPQFSRRTESTFTPSDSVRSSMRSSSAASSDGRITMVTDNISQLSDFDTYSLSTMSVQDSPSNVRKSAVSLPLGATAKTHNKYAAGDRKSVDSAIEHPSHSSQFDLGEEPGVYTVKVRKRPESSDSSSSEEEFTEEQLTHIKFKRMHSGGEKTTHNGTAQQQQQPEQQQQPQSQQQKKKAGQSQDDGLPRAAELTGARRRHKVPSAEPASHGPGWDGHAGGETNTDVPVHGSSSLPGSRLAHSDSFTSSSSKISDSSSEDDGQDPGVLTSSTTPSVRARVDALLAKHNKKGSFNSEVAQQNGEHGHNSMPQTQTSVHVTALYTADHTTVYPKEREGDFLDGEPAGTAGLHADWENSSSEGGGDDADVSAECIETSSFEDLEWDAEMLFPDIKEKKSPKAVEMEIEDELRSAIQDSFNANLISENGNQSPSSDSRRVRDYFDENSNRSPPDEADGYEYATYQTQPLPELRVNRFGRMYVADLDDDDDSLSVISERTEPEETTEEEYISEERSEESSSSSTEVDEDQYDVRIMAKLMAKRSTPSPTQANRARATPSPKLSPHDVKNTNTDRKSPVQPANKLTGHSVDKTNLHSQSSHKSPSSSSQGKADDAIVPVSAADVASQRQPVASAAKDADHSNTDRLSPSNTAKDGKRTTSVLDTPDAARLKEDVIVAEEAEKTKSSPVKDGSKTPATSQKVDFDGEEIPAWALERRDTLTEMALDAHRQGDGSTDEDEFARIFEQNKPFVSEKEWHEVMKDSSGYSDKQPKNVQGGGSSAKAGATGNGKRQLSVRGFVVSKAVAENFTSPPKQTEEVKTVPSKAETSQAMPKQESPSKKTTTPSSMTQKSPDKSPKGSAPAPITMVPASTTKSAKQKRGDPDSPVDETHVASVSELSKMFNHPPSYMMPGSARPVTPEPEESVRTEPRMITSPPDIEVTAPRSEVTQYKEVTVEKDFLHFEETILPADRELEKSFPGEASSGSPVKRGSEKKDLKDTNAKVAEMNDESLRQMTVEADVESDVTAGVQIVVTSAEPDKDTETICAISNDSHADDSNDAQKSVHDDSKTDEPVSTATTAQVAMEVNNNAKPSVVISPNSNVQSTTPDDVHGKVTTEKTKDIVPEISAALMVAKQQPSITLKEADDGKSDAEDRVFMEDSWEDDDNAYLKDRPISESVDQRFSTSTPDAKGETQRKQQKPDSDAGDGDMFAGETPSGLVATGGFFPSHDHEVLLDVASPGTEGTLTPGIDTAPASAQAHYLAPAPAQAHSLAPGQASPSPHQSQTSKAGGQVTNNSPSHSDSGHGTPVVRRARSPNVTTNSHRESFVYFDDSFSPSVEVPNLSCPSHDHEVLDVPSDQESLEADHNALWLRVESQRSRIPSQEDSEDIDDRVRNWLGLESPPLADRSSEGDPDCDNIDRTTDDEDRRDNILVVHSESQGGSLSVSDSVTTVSAVSERDSAGPGWDSPQDPVHVMPNYASHPLYSGSYNDGRFLLPYKHIPVTDLDASSIDSGGLGDFHEEVMSALSEKSHPKPPTPGTPSADDPHPHSEADPEGLIPVTDSQVSSLYLAKSQSQSAGASVASLEVLIDDASETADERAHPEKLEEDFALSLDLGPYVEGEGPSKARNLPDRVDSFRNKGEAQDDSNTLRVEGCSVGGNSYSVSNPGGVEITPSTNFSSHPLTSSSAAETSAQGVASKPPHPSAPSLSSNCPPGAQLTTPARDTGSIVDNDNTPLATVAGVTTVVKVTSHRDDDDTDSDLDVDDVGREQDATMEENNGAPYDSQTEADRHQNGDVRPASDTGSEATGSYHAGSTRSRGSGSDAGAVPAIAVVHAADVAEKSSVRSANVSDREEDNIDDIVASYGGSQTGSINSRSAADESALSQRSTALLSPFSDRTSKSRESLLASRESIMSYYSDAGEGNYGKIPVTGEIQFALEYNYKSGIFEIKVKQCRDLAPVDTKRKRSDPYVKTYLLPDKTKTGKRKTRIKKHTVSPVYNETLRYHLTKSEIETRTLWLTVWHNDTFGRNDFLGEVTLPLDYHSFDDVSPKWYRLQDRPKPMEDEYGNPSPLALLTYKGDLNISLKYVTAENVVGKKRSRGGGGKGILQVLVKQARNLTAVRANGYSDPFCKGYLLPERSRNTKQKTPVVKRNCNPEFNHTFVFEDVMLEELRERSLELTLWDHDRFTSNDFLGGVRLGLGTGASNGKEVDWMDSKDEEVSIWQAMLETPNYWKEGTLLLRPNMDRRK